MADITKEQAENATQTIADLREKSSLTKEEQESLQRSIALYEKYNKLRGESVDLLEQSVKFAKEELAASEQQAKGLVGMFDSEKKRFDVARSRKNLLEAELELLQKDETKNKELIEQKKKELEQHKLVTNELENQLKKSEQQTRRFEIIKNQIGSIANSARGLASTINSSMGGMFPLANVLDFGSAMAALGRASREAAEANANFVKTTGQSASMLKNMQGSLGGFGILYKDQAAAYGELYTTMSNFSRLDGQLQGQMVNAAARMKNLGVDVAATGKNYDELTLALRMNSQQAMETQDKIAKVAIGAGIAPSKMLKEFASAMPQLAGYGKKAVEVFTDLQKQSKSLGIEMQSLLGIVGSGFDTFEGAAEKAGKLNAILGGNYINSVELLNASESERVEILKRGMEASGKSMESMGKFGQLAVGNAMGTKNLSEVNKLFGKSTSEMKNDMNTQEASQRQLIKAQKDAGDVANKLEAATRKLAEALKPIQQLLTKLAEMFTSLSPETQKYIVLAFTLGGPALGALAVGLNIVKTAISLFTISTTTAGAAATTASAGIATTGVAAAEAGAAAATATPAIAGVGAAAAEAGVAGAAAGPGLSSAAAGTTTMGTAASLSAGQIMAFGIAIMFVGAGIGLAAYGLSFLVSAFKDLTGEQILGGLGALVIVMGGFAGMLAIMIPIITAMGAVSAAVGGPLIALGVAFLLIGGGIAIAAYGLSILVDSFTKLAATGKDATPALWGMAIAMGGFVAIMGVMIPIITALGAVSAAVAGPLLALGAAMFLIGAGFAVAMMGLSTLTEMAKNPNAGINLIQIAAGVMALSFALTAMNAVGTGGAILSFFGGGATGFAGQIKEIVAAISEIPDNIDVKVNALKDVKETLSVAATINTEKIKPSMDFVKEVKGFYEAQVKAKQGEQDIFLSILKGVSKSSDTDKAGSKSGEIPIILRIENSSDIRAALSVGAAAAIGQGKQ